MRKLTILMIALGSTLTILACAGDSGTPTSPTVAGPPVAAPAPEPEPAPAPTVPNDGTAITVRGAINRMSRTGDNGIDVLFRIGDEPWIRGDAATAVIGGSFTFTTSALRDGQTVTIDGRQRDGFVYAKTVNIDTNP